MSMEEDEDKGHVHLVAYRMMADTAERAMDRRQAANNFFIAMNVAITGGYAFMIKEDQMSLLPAGAALGFFVCFLWCVTLWYYRELARAKFRILGEYEVLQGIDGYQREWELFKARNPVVKAGFSLSWVEFAIAFIGLVAHPFAPLIFHKLNLAHT